MRTRLQLSEILNSIPGPKKVYYQPPEGTKLQYPCIIYNLTGINNRHADNDKYIGMRRYDVIVIDKDPDSAIYEKVLELRNSSFSRVYVSDMLYHFVINLYF